MSIETDQFTKHFMAVEKKLSLFEIQIDRIPIWERVRYEIYYDLKRDDSKSNNYSSNEDTTLKKLKPYYDDTKGISLWLTNLFIKNPYVSSECGFLFWGHQRRKLHDRMWWDIYCDPLHDEFDFDALHLEVAHKGKTVGHLTPAKTKNIKYLDFPVFTGTIVRELFGEHYPIKENKLNEIKSIEKEIAERFGKPVDLEGIVRKKLAERKGRKKLYDILLRRLEPEIVFLVVSAFRDTFIESCKDLNIPTIELQHGGFGPDHPGYSFPNNRVKETFPDYLFTFGEFWKDRVDFPIPDSDVYPVGFPYLQLQKDKYNKIQAEKTILFISQGPVGETITKFASKYAKIEDSYDVVIKLHPDEYNDWETKYPWLTTAPLTVVDKNEPPLYKLLASSTVQVGVTSTVVYEGLVFDLDTYLLDHFRPMRTDHLVDDGIARFVSSPENLYSALRTEWNPTGANMDYYFESQPFQKTEEAINDILQRESI